MRSHRIPFGVSICYTSKNYKVVTSDEFLDLLISNGCVFAWYFHYMPVGVNASTDLLLTPEQRAYMKDRIREIRGITGGKELYCIDFQNDGEFAGGCVAGGRIYCHINRKKCRFSKKAALFSGASDLTRTGDLLITSAG